MSFIYLFKYIYRAFRKHVWVNIAEGNFSKPWHFFKAVLKYRLFGYPYVALVEVGSYCNLKCPTCPTPGDRIHRKKELMNLENYKKVINNIKDSVHIILLYFANEPLLNPDIAAMVRYAHKKNLYTEISTNATLLNQEKAKELLASGLDKIILDFDGTTKESFEKFRVGANFEQVYENIKYFCRQKQLLKLRKPFIELEFILNKYNQHEVEDVKKIAKELKVDRLYVKSLSLGEHVYSKEEIKELSEKFLPDIPEYKEKIRYKKEGDGVQIKKSPAKCPLAKSTLVVLTDGRVSMCCYDLNGQYVYGSVFSQKLKDIWFSREVKEKRRLAREKRYPLCKTCTIYSND